MSSDISSRSRRTPRPVQIHAVRSKRTGDGYSWRKCRRCINSTCISLCHEFSSGFSCEDRRCSRKDAESMCHVYFTIVFIIVDSSRNTYFATSGKVLCFIKGCFFCSNDVIQIQCFCRKLELQPVWCVLLSTDFFYNTRGKAALVICILHCHTHVSIQYVALNGSMLCIFYFRKEHNVTQNFMLLLECIWTDYQ